MNKGVRLTKAPQPWQIIQQTNGRAQVLLEGTSEPYPPKQADLAAPLTVYARIVLENDGSQVIPWTAMKRSSDGCFSGALGNIPAGGLYRLETCLVRGQGSFDWAMRGDAVSHIGVGDVFLIAGQSNAAGYGRGETEDPVSLMVHMLRLNGRWDMACNPLNDSTDAIFPACAATHNTGVSPYLTFARILSERLHFPIGLVPAALGASALDAWGKDRALYQELIARKPFVGEVKGLLWYQGCADTTFEASRSYAARFSAFLERLFADWGCVFPVLTVQIGRNDIFQSDEISEAWSYMRETQRKIAMQNPDVWMVPSYDLPRGDPIHLSAQGQSMLGKRLAVKALQCLYGVPVSGTAPELAGLKRLDARSLLATFSPLCHGLSLFAETLPNRLFFLEDERGPIGITHVEGYRLDGLILHLNREAGQNGRITYLPGTGVDGPYPRDATSLLPIVPFDKIPF